MDPRAYGMIFAFVGHHFFILFHAMVRQPPDFGGNSVRNSSLFLVFPARSGSAVVLGHDITVPND